MSTSLRDRLDELLRAETSTERLLQVAEIGGRMGAVLQAQGYDRLAKIFNYAVARLVEDRIPDYLFAAFNLKEAPPTIDEFLDDEKFWRDTGEIWPKLRAKIVEACPYPFLTQTPIHEWVMGGGTGTGKTESTLTAQGYHLMLLHHFRRPQEVYGLAPNTPLVILFQSVLESVTNRVLYKPFRGKFLSMPWSVQECTWDHDRESALIFDNGIEVSYAIATVEHILGQAVISAIIDEVNFMAVVEKSKQVSGARGQGGRYDQAQEIVTAVSRRRKRSALGRGPRPGMISILSSTRYKADFIDRRQEQVRASKEPGVLLFREAQYDIVPQSRFRGPKMRVLVGTERAATRILDESETAGVDYHESSDVRLVPVEYRSEFESNPEQALRDIIGVATDSISAFIAQRHKVSESMARATDLGFTSFLVKDDVDYAVDGMPDVVYSRLPKDKMARRFVHVDLSTTSDRCGIAMARIVGSTQVPLDNTDNPEGALFEVVPHFIVEMACSIQPSKVKELDPSDVRAWILRLKNYYGLNIHQVSYDGYKSDESIRLLRKAGVRSKELSLDKTEEPYQYLRRGLYQDRIDLVENDLLREELTQLEHDVNGKPPIDHPPSGSKDVSDAVCGAVFAASQSRVERAALDVIDEGGQNVRETDPSGQRRAPQRRR